MGEAGSGALGRYLWVLYTLLLVVKILNYLKLLHCRRERKKGTK